MEKVAPKAEARRRSEPKDIKRADGKKKARMSFFKKIMIAAALSFIVILVLSSPVFNVTAIEIEGNERLTRQEVYNSGIIEDVNIFSVSTSKSKTALMQNPYVRSVDISKIYPDKIIVSIEERKARAYIEYKNMNQYILVDEYGMVLGVHQYTTSREELPIVVGVEFEPYKIGEYLEASSTGAFNTVVTLSKAFEKYGLADVDKIDLSNLQDIHIYVGKHVLLIGDIKEIDTKINFFVNARAQGAIPDFRGTFTYRDITKDPVFSYLN